MAETKKIKTPPKGKKVTAKAPSQNAYVPRLKNQYQDTVLPELLKNFSYRNRYEAPRLEKIVINIGMGAAIQNAKLLDAAVKELSLISGQRPVLTKAKKSIAGFKIREGMVIGCRVTLRGTRMFEFMDRLCSTGLPRIRDFRGLSVKSFDGRGNYTLGLKEQLIFPEIQFDDVIATHGMDVTFVTTAGTNKEGRALLELMGIPFRKD